MASSSIAPLVLMKKGKRAAAQYIQAECSNTTSPQHLNELLDLLLNPGKAIDEWETIDWCKWLMASGQTPDEFANTGKDDSEPSKNILKLFQFISIIIINKYTLKKLFYG